VRCRLSYIVAALFIILELKTAGAQSMETSALLVLRAQTASIARDVVRQVKSSLPDSARVVVRVESKTNQTMVENAFVETLSRSLLKPLLPVSAPPGVPAIDVLVLAQSVDYREIPAGAFERTVKTILEARFQPADGADIEYLGSFQRTSADTVAQRDDVQAIRRSPERVPENASFFDRIAGPVLIITGAFLVIYLFFTVRN
jgi:hypothetical protein